MRKKTSQLKNYIVATGVFIIAVVIGILVFFAGVQLIIPGLFEPPVRTLRATIPENESHIFR